MKVVRVNSYKGSSKTVAFVDIQTDEEIVIKGFKLVNGTNGLFLAPPNEKGKDGKYYESVVVPPTAKSSLEKMAIEEYNKVH